MTGPTSGAGFARASSLSPRLCRAPSLLFGLAALTLIAACAKTPAPPPARPAPAPPPAAVTPPPGAEINRDLSQQEAIWHLRSALNVAALSCGSHAGDVMVQGYNRLLAAQKAELGKAFTAEQSRYGDAGRALDGHMTRVYNYFAWPPGQQAFCAAAKEVVTELAAMDPAAFAAAAPVALQQLDTALATPGATPAAMATRAAPAVAAATAPDWRIQLGAFTGQAKAEAAWDKISGHSPEIAALQPRFEPVPGKPLVRLQVDQRISRANAVRLCAIAAASGFDCFPVAG